MWLDPEKEKPQPWTQITTIIDREVKELYWISIHTSIPIMSICVCIYVFSQHLSVASQLKAKRWIAHMRHLHQAPQPIATQLHWPCLQGRCARWGPFKNSHPHQVGFKICFTKRTCFTCSIISGDDKSTIWFFQNVSSVKHLALSTLKSCWL